MSARWMAGLLVLCFALVGCKRSHDEHASHDEQEEAEGIIQVSPEALKRLGIRVEPVRKGIVSGVAEVPAEVRLDPDRTAHVAPLVVGQIAEVHARLGDRVAEGDKLVVLRSVDLGDARAAMSRARAALEVAKDELARQEKLRDAGVGAERNFVQAQGAVKRAQADLAAASSRAHVIGGASGSGASMVISSPLTGTIIERHATKGELASPDSALFVVTDLSRVWVIGDVYEQHVQLARKGSSTVLQLRAYPARRWAGEISFVADQLDERSRTLEVRVELDNPDGDLRPGLFGNLALVPSNAKQVLVVPEAALQDVDGKAHVFVAEDHAGEFHALPVTVGARGSGQAEIVSGISAGTRIATSGTFELKSVLLSSRLGHGHAH